VRGITDAEELIMPSRAKKVDAKKVDLDVANLPSITRALVDLFLSVSITGEAINEAGSYRTRPAVGS
jgi:hypothetical protein